MDFSIDIKEKDGLRTLHFDSRWTQGAMRIEQPWALELEYTRAMMACLLLRDESSFPRNVLMIGLGAGSLPKFFYRHFPAAQLTVVEIDPRVEEAARRYFHLPDDTQRLKVVIGDGAEYVRSCGQNYDLILVDGFNEHAHPGDLNTLPFYQACRERLSEQGVLAVNLIGLSHGVKGGFAHVEDAFDHRAVMFPKCKSGNTIAFSATGECINIALDALMNKSRALELCTGLSLLPMLSRLSEDQVGQDGVLRI